MNTTLPPLDGQAYHRLFRKLRHKVASYPEPTPIIIYCKTGTRAKTAKEILEMLGYRNVANLGGVDIEPLNSVMSGQIKSKGLDVCLCKNRK